jgi:hypothetical protein
MVITKITLHQMEVPVQHGVQEIRQAYFLDSVQLR